MPTKLNFKIVIFVTLSCKTRITAETGIHNLHWEVGVAAKHLGRLKERASSSISLKARHFIIRTKLKICLLFIPFSFNFMKLQYSHIFVHYLTVKKSRFYHSLEVSRNKEQIPSLIG